MKKLSFLMVVTLIVGVSCTPNVPETPVSPTPVDTGHVTPPTPPKPPIVDSTYIENMAPFATTRSEKYRPQVHYTPIKNWVNDPNGLVYREGIWHMFYQYNPYGNGWGFMSWGHATSTDMVHWTEQDVALLKDDLGDVFSGSSVIDFDNRAGFGKDAIISFYTAAGPNGTHGQQQAMAYSVDGITWSREGVNNPIIPNPAHDDNFRDPKVFYDREHDQYVMALANGWLMSAEFWVSKDLKNWTFASKLRYPIVGRPSFQWECPDLMQLPVMVNGQSSNGQSKWVLIVSVNPGGPVSGSGTMYFLGDWDGTTFTVEEAPYPLWLDYGMDNYAAVTWSNAPDNRKVLLGWMNNWVYSGNVPCSPWRSAFTLPRELTLRQVGDRTLLSSLPIPEIDQFAGEWKEWPIKGDTLATVGMQAAYEAEITIPSDKDVTLTFTNRMKEMLTLEYYASAHSLFLYRNDASGAMVPQFKQTMSAPVFSEDETLTLRLVIDQSSIEIFTADGLSVLTSLCYPSLIYHRIYRRGPVLSCRTRTYESIWK